MRALQRMVLQRCADSTFENLFCEFVVGGSVYIQKEMFSAGQVSQFSELNPTRADLCEQRAGHVLAGRDQSRRFLGIDFAPIDGAERLRAAVRLNRNDRIKRVRVELPQSDEEIHSNERQVAGHYDCRYGSASAES